MPDTEVLNGDKGYDSDEFRDALKARKINACIRPPIKPDRAERLLQSPVQKALQNRKHVRNVQGLAACLNQI